MQKLIVVGVPQKEEWEVLRNQKRALHPHDYAMNPCRFCSAECCKSAVRITLVEALRIGFTLGLPLERFVVPHLLTDDDGPSENCTPLLVGEEHIELCLRRLDDGGRCLFVQELDEEEMFCSIHNLRPGACRFFPFSIVEDDGKEWSVGTELLCPVKWIQDEGLAQRLGQELKAWKTDIETERKFCATWNDDKRDDRSFQGLLDYMLNEVAPALGYDLRTLTPLPKRGLGKRLW